MATIDLFINVGLGGLGCDASVCVDDEAGEEVVVEVVVAVGAEVVVEVDGVATGACCVVGAACGVVAVGATVFLLGALAVCADIPIEKRAEQARRKSDFFIVFFYLIKIRQY